MCQNKLTVTQVTSKQGFDAGLRYVVFMYMSPAACYLCKKEKAFVCRSLVYNKKQKLQKTSEPKRLVVEYTNNFKLITRLKLYFNFKTKYVFPHEHQLN